MVPTTLRKTQNNLSMAGEGKKILADITLPESGLSPPEGDR